MPDALLGEPSEAEVLEIAELAAEPRLGAEGVRRLCHGVGDRVLPARLAPGGNTGWYSGGGV